MHAELTEKRQDVVFLIEKSWLLFVGLTRLIFFSNLFGNRIFAQTIDRFIITVKRVTAAS